MEAVVAILVDDDEEAVGNDCRLLLLVDASGCCWCCRSAESSFLRLSMMFLVWRTCCRLEASDCLGKVRKKDYIGCYCVNFFLITFVNVNLKQKYFRSLIQHNLMLNLTSSLLIQEYDLSYYGSFNQIITSLNSTT